MKQEIKALKNSLTKIHPLPWTFSGNIPFSVTMKKPRQSLSKHNDKSEALWHWEDGNYASMCINMMPKLLEYIEELEKKVEQNE